MTVEEWPRSGSGCWIWRSLVREACVEKLGTSCGPEQVGELPAVPSAVDGGELPAVPALDDPKAVEAWRDALSALSFERGEKQGEERGRLSGIAEGQARAVIAILLAWGIPVDTENQAIIEGCRDSLVLERWIARAAVVGSAREVVEPGE